MGKELEQLIYLIIGSLFTSIILYIIKGFFTNLEARVEKAEKSFSSKLKDVDAKIEKILDAHNLIYSDILTKFSNWEDRIKKILYEVPNHAVNNSPSGEYFKEYIINSFVELDNSVKRDMNIVKRDMDIMSTELKKAEFIAGGMKGTEQDRRAVNSLIQTMKKIEEEKNEQVDIIEKKIVTIYSVCKVLMKENKELEKKIASLTESIKTRIRLSDKT